MTFLYILLAIAVLMIMITVHEFGHYIAGKLLGFQINEFSIGFGPAIYKKKKPNGEIFAIRWVPLGGYCAFEGEDEDYTESAETNEENKNLEDNKENEIIKQEKVKPQNNPRAFNNMKPWKRIIVLLAGVTFNFLFGVLTSVIYLMVAGFNTPKITNVVNQQGISAIGVRKNDIIMAVNGKTIEKYRSFTDLLAKYKEGEEFTLTVERDGKIIDVKTKKQKFPGFYFVNNSAELKKVLFKFDGTNYSELSDAELDMLSEQIINSSTAVETTDEQKASGFALKSVLENYYYKQEAEYIQASQDEIVNLLVKGNAESEIYSLITYANASIGLGFVNIQVKQSYGFFESCLKAWPFMIYMSGLILGALGGLFTGATALKDMGGTVTAVTEMAQITKLGIEPFLLLLPLLSANLALFNVLPIPALDGARALFVLYEMIFRKPVNRKVEGYIHTIGLFLLLGIVIFFDIYHFAAAVRLLI